MWIKFWKRSGANWTLDETYRYYPKKESEGTLKYDAEGWAQSTPGGSERGFEYGWKTVRNPPVEWLKKHKDYIVDEINELDKKHGVYDETLKKICKAKGHVIERSKTDLNIGICTVCSKIFDWWCPVNSKHYCEFDSTKGKGKYCIHCGQSKEGLRK